MGACPLQTHAAQHPAVLAHETGALPVAYGLLLAPALALCPTQVRMVPSRPGIAFVEYSDEVQAGLALQGLQGFKLATGEAARRDVHPRRCEAALLHSVICGAAGPGGCTNDLLCLGLEEGWERTAGGQGAWQCCALRQVCVSDVAVRPALCTELGPGCCSAAVSGALVALLTSAFPSRPCRQAHVHHVCKGMSPPHPRAHPPTAAAAAFPAALHSSGQQPAVWPSAGHRLRQERLPCTLQRFPNYQCSLDL